MSVSDHRCWACGELAPGGVCMREHPDFNWLKARVADHVSGGTTITVTAAKRAECSVTRTEKARRAQYFYVEPQAAPRPRKRKVRALAICRDCRRRLTRDPEGTWCEHCIKVVEAIRFDGQRYADHRTGVKL